MIGSRYSQDTFCVRDFLAKNRVLFTWLDLEADPQVGSLLRQFGMREADTPVVACTPSAGDTPRGGPAHGHGRRRGAAPPR